MERNKIILLGGNHHNGLGLVRSFGVNGLKPYGIIIGPGTRNSFVRKSRYWEKTWSVETEEQALELLMMEFSSEKRKPVIIPWSDGAAEVIDSHLDQLLSFFIVPSFNRQQGEIVKLMDKQKQVEFLENAELPMAKTWTVAFPLERVPEDLVYPCIVKPVSSYEGNKTDIRKCDSYNDLTNYLKKLELKKYSRILIQEYLNYDYEFEFVGSCGPDPAYIISKNVRVWPVVGGTNSFLKVMVDEKCHSTCRAILKFLQKKNYFGMFDIEMFFMNGKIYVNEINWRNTGNSFLCLGSNVHYAVIWYLNAIGEDTSHLLHVSNDSSQYGMNESTDIRHVVFNGYGFGKWMKDRKKTSSFALWYIKDMKPVFAQYVYLVKEFVLHRRKG